MKCFDAPNHFRFAGAAVLILERGFPTRSGCDIVEALNARSPDEICGNHFRRIAVEVSGNSPQAIDGIERTMNSTVWGANLSGNGMLPQFSRGIIGLSPD